MLCNELSYAFTYSSHLMKSIFLTNLMQSICEITLKIYKSIIRTKDLIEKKYILTKEIRPIYFSV